MKDNRFILPTLAIAGVYLFLLLIAVAYPDGRHTVEVRLTASVPEASEYLEVFWARAHRYRQQDSVKVYHGAVGLHEHTVSFSVGPRQRSLRVDPANAAGVIELVELHATVGGREYALDARELKQRIVLTNDIDALELREGRLLLNAVGADPFFGMAIDDLVPTPRFSQRTAKALILLLAVGVFIAAEVAARRELWAPDQSVNRWAFALFLVLLALPLLLGEFGYGCPDKACGPRAYIGAGKLLAAVATFWLFGYGLGQRLLKMDLRGQVYLPVILGQVILVLYAYARSLMPIPLSHYEVFAGAGLVAIWLWLTRPQRPWAQGHDPLGIFIKVVFLFAILAVIHSREVPRELMLSTDPDTHLAYIKQFLSQGRVPWHAGDWGAASLGYPMGIAVLGGLWSWAGFFGPGDTLAHLPMVLSVLASLAIVEFWRFRNRSPILLLALSCVLLLSFAGLLIPLLAPYAHQEGTARQLSIPFAVLLVYGGYLLAAAGTEARVKVQLRLGSLLLGSLLVLAFLNPVNLVVPAIALAALSVYWLAHSRRLGCWMLVAPALLLALLLDPYYHGMVFGPPAAAKLELSGATELTLEQILTGLYLQLAKLQLSHEYLPLFAGGQERKIPDFALLGGVFLFVALASSSVARSAALPSLVAKAPAVAGALIVGVALFYFADSLFAALLGDARYYLLARYFAFSVSQYQIVILLLLAVAALLGVSRLSGTVVAPAVLVVTASVFTIVVLRGGYPYTSMVRANYCGAAGCVTQSERDLVVSTLQHLASVDALPSEAKVLVPNGVHQMGPEKWVFPVNVARLLAKEGDWPLAFYYYIGSDEYTTANYVENVCEGANLEWLRALGVRYTILPEQEAGYCLHPVLLTEAEVVLRYPTGRPGLIRLPGAAADR